MTLSNMEGFSPQRSPHSSRSPHPSRSPHLAPGSRSPMMTDGNMANPLKVSIALGQKPAIIQKGPFYLMKPEQIVMSEVTGATNLMASKNLEHSFQKLAGNVQLVSLSIFALLTSLLLQQRRWRTVSPASCQVCPASSTPAPARTTPAWGSW